MTPVIPTRLRRAMRSTRVRVTVRLVVSIGVLIAVVAHVGAGPLLHGLLSLEGPTIGAALLLGALATVAAAWRWRLVAARLGVHLGLWTAVGMYYRSQFLNTVLPGGIVGDVHRAVSVGESPEIVAQSARSVAIERTAGQVVQVTLTVFVVACLGAEFGGYLLVTIAIGIGIITAALVVTTRASARVRSALLRELRELRLGLGSVKASLRVALASVIVIACHVATFTIATAAVGARVPAPQMLTLGFVVLLGASIPFNIGGWGPREGIAGWAFALAGFGAAVGVSASTLFGVLAMISVAPGAIVTLAAAVPRRKPDRDAPAAAPVLVLATSSQEKTP